MKHLILVAIIVFSSMGCTPPPPPEPVVYGVKERIWETMSESERSLAIDRYYQHQKDVLESQERQRKVELEATKRQREIEAKNAPFEAAFKTLEKVFDKRKGSKTSYLTIAYIQHGHEIILSDGTRWDLAPGESFTVSNWLPNQKIELILEGGSFEIWPYRLVNISVNQSVRARIRK